VNEKATFTVIVPTTGRPTLRHTLASISSQLEAGDTLIVVRNDDGDFGNQARNRGIEVATTSHLVFLDDDDEWVPGALARMRLFADEQPGRIGIFRCRIEGVAEGPTTPDLGGTGTQNYVVPNLPGKVGRFRPADLSDPTFRALRPGETAEYLSVRLGDVEFIRSTVELQQSEPVWLPEVTTVLRPERNRVRRLRYKLRLRTRLRKLGPKAPRAARQP
jgi:glycosyltransferase involved in cell wall biosynthesis